MLMGIQNLFPRMPPAIKIFRCPDASPHASKIFFKGVVIGMFRWIAPQKLVCFQKLPIFDPKTFEISKLLTVFDDSRCKKHEISMFLVIFGVPGPESGQTNEFLKIPDSNPNKIFQGGDLGPKHSSRLENWLGGISDPHPSQLQWGMEMVGGHGGGMVARG